jgi:SAM-dependent methyltransferase
MPDTRNAAIFDYHRTMIAFHGNKGPAALGWRDQESQLIRFRVLAGMANFEGCSVLDAGCGHADLLGYLQSLFPGLCYTGVEMVPELLEEARTRYSGLPGITFFMADFSVDALPAVDYVLASGSLNYYQENPEFIFKAIAKLYDSCRIGLGFNLLRHIIPNGLLVAYDPVKIREYCESICNNVSFCMDYSEEDFTVFMYR